MERETRGHPLHPNCPLALDSSGKDFVCSACKLAGSRMYIYCCSNGCDFSLHGQCAKCPEKLSFWGHPQPQHELVLDRSLADKGKTQLELRPEVHAAIMSATPRGGIVPVFCEICTAEIEGMHYRCPSCVIFVHTVCAMLPKLVRSAAHQEHELALFCSAPTMCSGCQMPAVWAYRCMPCLAFYHLNCLPENDGVYDKPFSNLPPNPFIDVPPPMMMGHPGPGMVDEANPFGFAHTYRHRGL